MIRATTEQSGQQEQRAEFTKSVDSLRTEFNKLLHDHKSANLKLVETCQKSYITDILKTSHFTMNVLQSNAMLERQLADPNQKSSSSSGCCMGFLSCFRTTPAKAPAMAVVPNSIWDQKSSTAAQPAQLIFEHQQIIAELERKVAQLEATTTTGGLFGSGGLGGGGGGFFGSGGSGGGGLFGSGGLGNQ